MVLEKKYFIILFAIICFYSGTCLYSSNASVNFLKRTDTAVKFSYSNNDAKERTIIIIREALHPALKIDVKKKYETVVNRDKLSELANIESNYFIIADSNNLSILDKELISLSPSTGYFIDVYNIDKKNTITMNSFAFLTLAPEPSEQAYQIAFIGKETESITLTWTVGNGKGRIVFASRDSIIELPEDGVEYKPSVNFSDKESEVKNNSGTFCVYNSILNLEKRVTVKNIDYGEYFFRIFEFNGIGDSINYLTSSNKTNPRSKFIYVLKAPVALNAENIAKNSFDARWEHVERCQGYLLEVAEDEEFTKLIDIFNPADVGYCESINVDGLKSNTSYFYRLKTIGYEDISDYSNVIRVKTNKW